MHVSQFNSNKYNVFNGEKCLDQTPFSYISMYCIIVILKRFEEFALEQNENKLYIEEHCSIGCVPAFSIQPCSGQFFPVPSSCITRGRRE